MERDGKTRVYITSIENTAWEVYPVAQPYEQRVSGELALAILAQANYRGVSMVEYFTNKDGSWNVISDEWVVRNTRKKDGSLSTRKILLEMNNILS
jgi:hypothetical protein